MVWLGAGQSSFGSQVGGRLRVERVPFVREAAGQISEEAGPGFLTRVSERAWPGSTFRARTLYFLGRGAPLTYQERFRVCLMASQRRDPGGILLLVRRC